MSHSDIMMSFLEKWIALLSWARIAFDERIWIVILTRWLVTSHNCSPLIALTIAICSKGNYGQKNYAGSLFKTTNQDIIVTHQNKIFYTPKSAWPISTISPTNWRMEHQHYIFPWMNTTLVLRMIEHIDQSVKETFSFYLILYGIEIFS